MATQDTVKIKECILQFLKDNGPNLPIKISKHIRVDSLFASAFLSELLQDQKIKITHLKVGTSPIYYIPGTEDGLEKYSSNLKSKELEAFNLLKQNKFLEDETQHPAIRIALRNIKDFARPAKAGDKIIWRYFLTPISEYKKPEEKKEEILYKETIKKPEETENDSLPKTFISSIQKSFEEKEEKPKKEISQKEIPKKPEEKKKEIIIESPLKQEKAEPFFSNPLAQKNETKKPKGKPKSEFVIKTINFIENQGWHIIEELEYKSKEYNCLVQINSDLGPIIFLTQARDKKTISEADMTKLLGEAQSIPLPALIMCPGDVQKKAKPFLEKFTSVLKFKKTQ